MSCRRFLFLFLFLLAALVPRAAAGEEAADLPLRRVVLFTSGVGYFQRDGQVTDDARLELRFDAAEINDLLKSLVLRDLDGGQISRVTYASRDPVTRTLKSFAVDLTTRPSLGQILDQVRGEEVEVVAPIAVKGIVVGVEKVPMASGDTVIQAEFLNLLTDQGLHSVALSQVQRLRFVRAELDRELRQALAALAQGRDTQKKSVALHFTGEGKRRVRVAYITESPVWKTSYRLVLGEDAPPFLQGWAIVENTSDADWKDVRLTLVSGRPLSFIMDLYQPLYVKRPEVLLELYETLRPQKYADALEREEEEPMADKRLGAVARRKRARPLKEKKAASVTAGVPTLAKAAAVGDLFRYEIETPVTLPRQKSALLPIVNAPIQGERVSIYNESVHAKHPLNGLRLDNTTGLHLMQGPITVFDEGMYAGDARIDDLAPQGKRLISYAMDLDTEVEPIARGAPAELVSVRLAKGTLIATRRLQRERTYLIRNRGQKKRRVLVEHPFQADWKLLRPVATERTREVYRFAVPVDPGRKGEVAVVEERQLEQVTRLTSLARDAIELYLRAPAVSAAVKEALTKIAALQHELGQTATELRRRETRVKETAQEQRRIRDNMARLDRTSQLYARYVQILTKQEDALAQLHQRIEELRDLKARQQRALDEYLLSLEID
ncbi:MAG: hypothetical protein ACYTEZ_07415 [Planctomycetota bacterium]|jgi:hypothetical protein